MCVYIYVCIYNAAHVFRLMTNGLHDPVRYPSANEVLPHLFFGKTQRSLDVTGTNFWTRRY